MPPIHVHAAIRDTEVVVGCAFTVDITLTSVADGRALTEVQAPGADSPFAFVLRSPEHGELVVSKRLYEQARELHGAPPIDPQRVPLRPGESAVYLEDVAAWYVVAPPAGAYELEVRWQAPGGEQVAAAPVPVRIVPVQPQAAATAVDGSGLYLATVFAHLHAHANDGDATLFYRDAEYGRPELGRAIPWRHVPGPVAGLALATDVDEPLRWRWAAWLAGDSFGAAILWGSELVKEVEASPHGLADATLLPGGWQLADGTALFVLLGTRAGRAALDLVHLPPGSGPRHDIRDLDGPMPAAAVAGLWGRTLTTLELVRADVSEAGLTIGTQRIELSGSAVVEPVQPLLTTTGPLRALAVAPLLTDDAIVDLVTGDLTLSYHRTPILGGAGLTRTLEAPAHGSFSCSIATLPHPELPVLAASTDGLWLARSGEWATVPAQSSPPLHPQLVHLAPSDGLVPARLLATWFDAGRGYQVREPSEP